MAVHHPGKGQAITDLKHMVTQMVKAAMQNASYGSAGLRVHSGGFITIENGGLVVTGSANITGTLGGSGTFDWTGPWFLRGTGQITGDTTGTGQLTWSGSWDFTGNGEISGDVDITGDVEILGQMRIRGETTLENNLVVTNDGKIIVGDMTIEPVSGGGRVRFANGATVTADGAGASLALGSSRVFVDSQHAQMSHGGTLLSVANGSITAAGMGTFSEPTLPAGVLRTNALGRLERNVP